MVTDKRTEKWYETGFDIKGIYINSTSISLNEKRATTKSVMPKIMANIVRERKIYLFYFGEYIHT